jgi:hypothetical protein
MIIKLKRHNFNFRRPESLRQRTIYLDLRPPYTLPVCVAAQAHRSVRRLNCSWLQVSSRSMSKIFVIFQICTCLEVGPPLRSFCVGATFVACESSNLLLVFAGTAILGDS